MRKLKPVDTSENVIRSKYIIIDIDCQDPENFKSYTERLFLGIESFEGDKNRPTSITCSQLIDLNGFLKNGTENTVERTFKGVEIPGELKTALQLIEE